MPKTYGWPYQNPSYPEDRDMTVDEMEIAARAASMARAQSPNPLICAIDGAWSSDVPFHAHGFLECMNYRHRNVIGDDAPWTFWQTMDVAQFVPAVPEPALPIGLDGWLVRAVAGDIPLGSTLPPIPPAQPGVTRQWVIMASVDPATMFKVAGWQGYTFAQYISGAGVSPHVAGYALRVTLLGSFTINSLYIAAVDPTNPALGTRNHQFLFNGQNSGVATMDDAGNFIPLVTDELPIGIDATNGFWISGYFDPGGEGIVGESAQMGANFAVAYADNKSGDLSAELDKSQYTGALAGCAVTFLMLEGLFDPVQLLPPK
jgi:hypothetical protein